MAIMPKGGDVHIFWVFCIMCYNQYMKMAPTNQTRLMLAYDIKADEIFEAQSTTTSVTCKLPQN